MRWATNGKIGRGITQDEVAEDRKMNTGNHLPALTSTSRQDKEARCPTTPYFFRCPCNLYMLRLTQYKLTMLWTIP